MCRTGMLRAFFQDFPFRLAPGFKVAIHANVSAFHNHCHSLLLIFCFYSWQSQKSMFAATQALPIGTKRPSRQTPPIQETLTPRKPAFAISFLRLMKDLLHVVCMIALCSSIGSAQLPASTGQTQPATPTIRSTTRLVTVDVVVTENGHTVPGLTKDAFRILENGKEQETRNFDEHSYSADSAGPSAATAAKTSPPLPA